MLFKISKKILYLLFLINIQAFSLNNDASITKISSFQIKKMLRTKKVNVKKQNRIYLLEPSKYFVPNFYDKNELKDLFDTYEFVSEKIKNPIEIKKDDLVKSMEISILPHFNSVSSSSVLYSDFIFSLELKAIFL